MDFGNGKRVAVIGAGVAGLTAAHILQRKYRVTLFEKNDYAGGHTHTIVLSDGPDAGTAVDTGFIVMNHRNYPLFTKLLDQLGVELQDSEMSFGYHDCRTGLQYSGSGLNGLFGQRRNLLRPSFYRMVGDIFRFFREAERRLGDSSLEGMTLGEFLTQGRYGQDFMRHHLIPMGAAIWSTPCAEMLQFPASSFVRFFHNHGLLTVKDRPQWRTVRGGSHTYVKKILAGLQGEVVLGDGVASVRRAAKSVAVRTRGGQGGEYDFVVIAAHADEALGMLDDPSDAEKRLLGAWKYQVNRTVLHTDPSFMPPLRRVWASWNYSREADAPDTAPATLTYDMNRLQRLATREPLFVTLNAPRAFVGGRVLAEMNYDHPTYSFDAFASQHELPTLNGESRTWFCGSYFGYGFHEDAVRSAVNVVRKLGLDL